MFDVPAEYVEIFSEAGSGRERHGKHHGRGHCGGFKKGHCGPHRGWGHHHHPPPPHFMGPGMFGGPFGFGGFPCGPPPFHGHHAPPHAHGRHGGPHGHRFNGKPVMELDNEYVIIVDVPGLTEDEVKLGLSGKTLKLTITPFVASSSVEPAAAAREVKYTVPENVAIEAITASVTAGELTVMLPKKVEEYQEVPIVFGRSASGATEGDVAAAAGPPAAAPAAPAAPAVTAAAAAVAAVSIASTTDEDVESAMEDAEPAGAQDDMWVDVLSDNK